MLQSQRSFLKRCPVKGLVIETSMFFNKFIREQEFNFFARSFHCLQENWRDKMTPRCTRRQHKLIP